MAKLKLKASSLIEVIVSSLIMLIAFAISMDTLVRLSSTGSNDEDIVQMEMDIRECVKRNRVKEEAITYEWGEIVITKNDIGNGLVHITYSVNAVKQRKKIDFEKIIIDKDPN